MSSYLSMPPGPPIRDQSYATWRGAFTKEDLDKIVELGEAVPSQPATVFNDAAVEVDEGIRRTDVGWIARTPESDWLYEKLAYYAADLNARYFGFALSGFIEQLQYTIYRGSEDRPGKYDWHVDMGINTAAPRKLSLVVLLSSPEEYEGGELEFQGISTSQATKSQGDVNAFSSWVMHRVKPVTKGTRRSLVAWISGPQFL
ncbi:PKHD-type hydroxylase [Trinickia symbiotica]|uniref:Fe2OG dioxygenase domain-containing protein n=1 Tax=Trinickia symbiotica TaxID=863227 RepID=A0A2N7X5U6_9BURK|nr:2OG-Fe(II) oxygenase [Trinickia symbiotica]PMS37138.1 hypothetical protein C0Z20_10600 [Trinickia symbiotica]PPK42909.1 PKHD-type hydroxylase [Trinickia symbiotica]